MATITTKITTFPPAPDSGSDTPIEFNSKADAFVNHQSGVYVGEVNQWATEANTLKGEINQIKSDIEGIVASVPSGTINDNTTTTTNVWSASKVSSELSKIVESGVGYVKYEDGTMLCYGTGQGSTSGGNTVSFEQPFYNIKPSVSLSIIAIGQGDTNMYATKLFARELDRINVIVVRNDGNSNYFSNKYFTYMAIGRWK